MTKIVHIFERACCWEINWHDGGLSEKPTAAEALAAVKERGRVLAKDTGTSTLIVEWQPTTAIGRRVVKALQ